MKQIELELYLSKLKSNKNQKSYLEQYYTPSEIAASILYKSLAEGDISGKIVADLGTGNGIFAIGAWLLGARRVYGVDIDREMIEIASENAKVLGAEIEFINCDVSEFNAQVDTVIMNPPFGSQTRNADIPFLEKALDISKNFYILFNFKSSDFLKEFIGDRGKITWAKEINLKVPHTYKFHRKEVKEIKSIIAKVVVWK